MKPSEVIREARSVLFERGWNRDGLYEADDGSVCIVGALRVAAGSAEAARDAWYLCEDVNAETGSACIAKFNDDEAESFDDVLTFLDKAEKIAEEREAGR